MLHKRKVLSPSRIKAEPREDIGLFSAVIGRRVSLARWMEARHLAEKLAPGRPYSTNLRASER